jgi:hypothetical protein
VGTPQEPCPAGSFERIELACRVGHTLELFEACCPGRGRRLATGPIYMRKERVAAVDLRPLRW